MQRSRCDKEKEIMYVAGIYFHNTIYILDGLYLIQRN